MRFVTAAALVAASLIAAPAAGPASYAQQGPHTDQAVVVSVAGMACPFCAYGIEKKMAKVSNVASVEVDLDAGTVTLEPEPGKAIPEDEVRKAVKDSGFSLEQLEYVSASGRANAG